MLNERVGKATGDETILLPPDYRELYYRWEHEQWSSAAIDLAADRSQWHDRISPELKRSLLWVLAPSYLGKQQAVAALVPFVDAAPNEEPQVFLTTQLVDNARHAVFLDRFYAEVVDEGAHDMEERLELQADRLTPGSRTLLLEMLPEAAARIRADPDDRERLIEGVVLYHVVIEATLARTAQRIILDLARERDLLAGFRRGLTAVARDTSRHISFGVGFLREMVRSDDRCASVVVAALQRIEPVALSAIDPPDGDKAYYDPLGYGPADVASFARDSLAAHLSVIGVEPPA